MSIGDVAEFVRIQAARLGAGVAKPRMGWRLHPCRSRRGARLLSIDGLILYRAEVHEVTI